MFKNTRAFSGFSVEDLEKAKAFYGGILGLDFSEDQEMPGIMKLHIAGGTDIIVYSKPNHTPASFTILNFPVEDIADTVLKLKQKEVKFESYNMPGFKTDEDNVFRGGGPLIAWFTDPAGNILSVIQI